jgi:hypothetical protein
MSRVTLEALIEQPSVSNLLEHIPLRLYQLDCKIQFKSVHQHDSNINVKSHFSNNGSAH